MENKEQADGESVAAVQASYTSSFRPHAQVAYGLMH